MSTHLKTLATLAAALVVGSTAHAQSYTYAQTAVGQIVPARTATTTQTLMANVELVVAPTVAPEPVRTDATDRSIGITDGDLNTWNAVAAVEPNGNAKAEGEEEQDGTGFLGSTMGRASIVGLAGLAGASYFALRGDAAATSREQASFDTGESPEPTFTANPEPASMVLMATGLLGLGIAARRRRSH